MSNNIHGKALLVRLSIGLFAPTKRDKSATAEVLATKQARNGSAEVRKRLVAKDATGPLEKLAREIRSFHYTNTLPWDDEGTRLLPVANWTTYSDGIRGHRFTWDNLVNQFCADYATHRAAAQAQLGLLFDVRDYPDVTEVRHRFRLDTNWTPLPLGEDFRLHMNDEDMAELREELDGRVATAAEAAKSDLYLRLAERLKNVSERLADPDNIFRDSMIEGLRDLCRLMPNLNVSDDAELEALRLETLRNVAAFDPQVLRDDDHKRVKAKLAADAVLARMGITPNPIPALA